MFLGGEYSVRGFDIRTIGPRDPFSNIVTGGNKSLLFNAELYFNVGGPVRVLGFYDAGQVRDIRQNFAWTENITKGRATDAAIPLGSVRDGRPHATGHVGAADDSGGRHDERIQDLDGLRGPILHARAECAVPLIGAYNPSRRGILTTNFSRYRSSHSDSQSGLRSKELTVQVPGFPVPGSSLEPGTPRIRMYDDDFKSRLLGDLADVRDPDAERCLRR
jgi:hypothetical protein